jgi:uncharacterized protein YecE (DUF72 family)
VYALLKENNVALAWVDASKMPVTDEMTAEFVYVRLEGDRKAVTGTLGKVEQDKTESIKAWSNRLKPMMNQGTPVFCYFSKYFSGFPPTDVNAFLKQLEDT